jgi:transposase
VAPKGTGWPGYAPKNLLKLHLYGYLNRVRASRRLEAETPRNIEVIWLLRHLKPDFKTIADFRRDNRNAFLPTFRQFVLLCRQLDLSGRELTAVDGTRIKAFNNKDRNFTRASLTQFIKYAATNSPTICCVSTRAVPLKPRRPARASRTWLRRSPRSASGAHDAKTCGRGWSGPARTRSL